MLLALLLACSGTTTPIDTDTDVPDTDTDVPDTDPPVPATWDEGIAPFVQLRCGPCHTGYTFGGLDMEGRDSLVGVASSAGMAYITPGSLEDSYLWRKMQDTHLEAGGSGERMPLDLAPLNADEEALFTEWVLNGAP